MNGSIPVIMFHGVSKYPEHYPKPELVFEYSSFRSFLDYLAKNGFETIDLDDLYQLKTHKKINDKKKKIVLTFDDGFLDNYVFASVALEEYGMKGVMFCTTEFIDFEATSKRRRISDFDDEETLEKHDYLNYCNIEELRWLENSGIMSVQAHAASHSWVLSSSELVGLYKQTEIQPWLEWNNCIKIKPYQMTDLERVIPKGYPILSHDPTLGVPKQYFASDDYVEAMVDLFNNSQGLSKDRLLEEHKNFMSKYPGRYESKSEATSRIEYELSTSKSKLEEELNKEVKHMAWPNGKFCSEARELAESLFLSFQMPSDKVKNFVGENPQFYHRIGAPSSSACDEERILRLRRFILRIELSLGYYYKAVNYVVIRKKLNDKYLHDQRGDQKVNFDILNL